MAWHRKGDKQLTEPMITTDAQVRRQASSAWRIGIDQWNDSSFINFSAQSGNPNPGWSIIHKTTWNKLQCQMFHNAHASVQ